MVMRMLYEPLPPSWPKDAPARRPGLRGLLTWLTEMAVEVRRRDDVERRMKLGAMQAVVREAYQQTLAEQDSEQRRPAAFAEAWRTRLADLLAQETAEVSGWSQIATADLDLDLLWSFHATVDRARSEAITTATATPSQVRQVIGSAVPSYEFWITAPHEGSLGRVQYEVCEPCKVGLLLKISFSVEWQFCGLGTRALTQMETRHPGLVWYTTGQYSHAKGFYERYRRDSDSPWTENQHPCAHFRSPPAG